MSSSHATLEGLVGLYSLAQDRKHRNKMRRKF